MIKELSSQSRLMDIFVRKPVVSTVLSIFICLVGLWAVNAISVLQFPKIEGASLEITTNYTGASADVVKGFVTDPIERVASTVPGVDFVESSTGSGQSKVTAWLQLNQNSTNALAELNTRLNQIKFELPVGAEDPFVTVVRTDRPFAVFYLNVLAEGSTLAQITDYLTREINPIINNIEGVQKVGIEGARTPAMRVWLDADRLNITTVNVGGEPQQIVCGAPNVAVGQKVVVAIPGTVLYTDEGEAFKIKKSKIRGVESLGMICGPDEIGFGGAHDGIMVLDVDAIPGTPAPEYFKIEKDTQIEIGLTPNRADAMGHIGVARDILAAFKYKGITPKETQLSWPNVSEFKVDNNSLPITVEVLNSEACPRYCGVSISGVKVEESPEWLQNRLKAIDLAPINNIVDITNFVLHEYGQPLHAFDANKIEGNKVIVKTVEANTKFTTLDDTERTLHAEDLMIANASEGMCIAGVFGGAKSGITDTTVNVFLESAYFNPVSVRKTAKRHGLNTDASFRFERGIDPNLTVEALKRAALLIKEIAGGTISSEITDIYPEVMEDFQVHLSYEKTFRIIGEEISTDTMACDSVLFNNTYVTQSGIYYDSLVSVKGCDSVVIADIVIAKDDSLFTVSACDSFQFYGTYYYQSGLYTEPFLNQYGCDSNVVLDLTILQNSAHQQAIFSCDSFQYNNVFYTSSTTIYDTLVNANGCDSVLTLDLEIVTSTYFEINDTVCTDTIINGITVRADTTINAYFTGVNGCDSLFQTNVMVINQSSHSELLGTRCPTIRIFIPNAFTPGNDNINETFHIVGVPRPYSFQVFDRWGKMVYDNADYDNSWDGTLNGKPLPMGVYVYRLEYSSDYFYNIIRPTGLPHPITPITGKVNIIR